MKRILFALLTILACCVTACKSEKKARDMSEETRLKIETTAGDIVVKLYNETPKHRDNFIKLAENGTYEGTLFHRVIKDFMIQAGDPESKKAAKGQMLGSGDVGYTVPAEFVYPKYFHKKGALSAARQGDNVNPEKASSGCQFYIVTGKVYSDSTLLGMEQQMNQMRFNNLFNTLASKHAKDIYKMRKAGDQEGLMKLQDTLIAQVEKQLAGQPEFRFTPEQVKAYLKAHEVRALVDDRNEKIGRKIRDNEMKRIPYMLIVGEKEMENGEVSVRKQGEGDKGTMKYEDFAKILNEEVQNMINKY